MTRGSRTAQQERHRWKGWRANSEATEVVRRFEPIDRPRIVAKHDFVCDRCGGPGKAGERIVWFAARKRPPRAAKAIHDRCAS